MSVCFLTLLTTSHARFFLSLRSSIFQRAKDKYFGNAIDADQATPNIRTDGTLSPGFDANAFLNNPFDQTY